MTRMSYQWNDNKDGMDANLFQVRDRDGFARTEINEKPHQGTAYNEAYKAGLSIETTQFLPSKPGSPTSASTPLNVDGWQDKPTPLKKDWAGFAVDFLRILTVVGLMGFGVAAYLSDDKEITDWKATKVKQASKWFTSIFPIAYTALMAKTLRDIALALLIRGTHLMTIEQLLQNSSVGATFVTALKFRSLHIVPLVLFLVWAFSPLGGQGALRILDTYEKVETQRNGVAYYILPNATTIFSTDIQDRRGDLKSWKPVSYFFISSMVASSRPDRDAMRRDNLGHIRIPRISTLSKKPGKNGWIPVSATDDVWEDSFRYSSFMGIPTITNSTSNRNSFIMPTSYLEFHCSERRWISPEEYLPTPIEKIEDPKRLAKMMKEDSACNPNGGWRGIRGMFSIYIQPNQTNYTISDLESGLVKRATPLQTLVRISHHPHMRDRVLQYHPEQVDKSDPYFGTLLQYACDFVEPKVEVEVTCIPNDKASAAKANLGETGITAGICEVTAMRHDPRHPSVEDTYTTSMDSINGDILRDALFAKIGSAGQTDNSEMSAGDYKTILPLMYLKDPSLMMGWEADGTEVDYEKHNLATVSPKDMSDRLTMFFNGFLHASQTPFLRSLGIPINRTLTDRWSGLFPFTPEEKAINWTSVIYPTLEGGRFRYRKEANGREAYEVGKNNIGVAPNTSTIVTEVYRINITWLTVYLCSCLVLLISVLSGVIYRLRFIWRTGAPDILTYFSSLSRDNPYMRIPEDTTGFAGTPMDGAERAKMLGHVRVRLGDVRAEDERVGHIALFREDLYGDVPRLGADPKRKYR